MRAVRALLTIICIILLFGASLPAAWANAGVTTTTQASSPIKTARKLLGNHKYDEALLILEKAVRAEPKNADVLNLTGYAYREIGQLDDALVYYNRALAVDPEHKGTLNYLGMLFVSTGQMDEANALLVRLDDACFFGCDEYNTLKEAIETGVVPETAVW